MEVEEATCLYILYRRYKIRKRRQRQWWVHPILKDRLTHGAFVTLYPSLRKYGMKFFNYFRMSIKSFDELLQIIKHDIEPCSNVVRDSVSPEEKLVITLRYLATGCSFAELHYNYRLGKSTVSLVVRQVCAAIWIKLKTVCTPEMTEDMWKAVSDDFMKYANFPNCLGAIDCKHIRIVQPQDSGSLYYNYKHFFSTILLAVCDANYRFLFVDVGAYGKSNDSSIFQDSKFYKNLIENKLSIPGPKPITNVDKTPLPHVFVGDDAFGLSKNILRPYVGNALIWQKRVFNYRLSRARRYIECTFGILANKWRIFHRPLNVNLDLAESIILACCMLHNYVRQRDGVRFEDTLYEAPFIRLNDTNLPRSNMYAKQVRDKFARYFVEEGKLPWQDRMA